MTEVEANRSESSGEVWQQVQIMDHIERNGDVSQRNIAQSAGIALGLTNQILKRLIRKGLVKTSKINARRMAYYLTPEGFTEKLKLVMDYTRTTISFFSTVREITKHKLLELRQQDGIQTIAIVGVGELAEAVYLSAQQLDLEVRVVYDGSSKESTWLGVPRLALVGGPVVKSDALFVTELYPRASTIDLSEFAPLVIEISELMSKGLAGYAARVEEEEALRLDQKKL